MRAPKIAGIVASAILALGMLGTAWVLFSTPPVHWLALAPDLIDATSAAGQQLLYGTPAKTDNGQLVPEFVSQSRRAFCGVASSVTVINALVQPQPRWNQDTLFTPKASAVKGELAISFSGLTLEQLAALVKAHGLQASATHAAQSSAQAFREVVKSTVSEPHAFLLVNYDRKVLAQEGRGPISPVAAYSAEKDAVLVLDVAAYKYSHTWVPLPKLWSAMNTHDADSGQTWGYLLVSASDAPPAVPAGAPLRGAGAERGQ